MVEISISDKNKRAQYRINHGPWTSEPGFIDSGDTVQVRYRKTLWEWLVGLWRYLLKRRAEPQNGDA